MADFELDLRLAATSEALADLPLCHVRLATDARWPWLLLIPCRAGLVELTDLAADDRAALFAEIDRAALAVRAVGEALGLPIGKLNIAALGNVVPQLHLHVIGRWTDDPAWPGPVWNVGGAEPYPPDRLAAACAAARRALGAA